MKIKSVSVLMTIVLTLSVLVMLPALPASAASGGPNYPATGQNITGVGTVAWSNPGNIVSNNNSNASASLNNSTTNYLRGTNYGFSIPSGASIAGIEVEIGRYGSTGSGADVRDNVVRLVKGGTIVGDNKADTGTDWPGSEDIAAYGGSADLWGTTWTPADINASDFGVVLAASSTNSRTANVDYIRVTVTYYVVEQNPDLLPGCAINVALVLDASASIDTASQGLVRNAANAFLAALENTGSEVAIVEFGTLADVPVDYAPVTPVSIASGGVFSNYLSPTNTTGPQYHDNRDSVDGGLFASYTNWDHAFYTTNTLTPQPDLVVFVTDGIPTARAGYPGSGSVVTGSTNPPPDEDMMDAAAASANFVKTNSGNDGYGSHIFAVGVTGSTGLEVGNLFAVLDSDPPGNTAFTAGPPSNFETADYTTTTDFSGLETALRNIALELCASSLTITKLVDEGDGNYVPGEDWTFTVNNVTVSSGNWQWKQPCQGGNGACADDTDANGQVFFQWLLDDVDASTTSLQIAETQQDGYELVDVTCTVDGEAQVVSQSETFTLSDIPRESSASCIVRNQTTGIPTGVTLADFSAACTGTAPEITWETVSELTNQGFNLYRSLDPVNPDTQLNPTLIPSQGPGSAQGFVYTWTDNTAQAGTEYFYWLEDVDLSGAANMHGPVSAICTSPTAVTLSDMNADSSTALTISGWMVALLLGALLAGFVAIKRLHPN